MNGDVLTCLGLTMHLTTSVVTDKWSNTDMRCDIKIVNGSPFGNRMMRGSASGFIYGNLDNDSLAGADGDHMLVG